MITLRYDVVDVFTDRPYAGNPLAVVHGGEDLSTAQMQAIAAEFGLSETAFPLPPTGGSSADYRVRIFTPVTELPFAGHPSVGTAWVLARNGVIAPGDRVQECAAGLLSVHVDAEGARIAGGTPAVGDNADAVALAAAVGLSPGYVGDDVSAGWAAAGLPYVFLLVRPDAVARAVPNSAAIRTLVDSPYGLVICALGPGATRVHARMFAPSAGTNEDPATGSAAVALGVYLADRGLIPPDGEHAFTITQGAEIGRPSTLHATVTCSSGVAVSTTVRGGVCAVMRGELVAVPPACGEAATG